VIIRALTCDKLVRTRTAADGVGVLAEVVWERTGGADGAGVG
jgi:hypothetical protein